MRLSGEGDRDGLALEARVTGFDTLRSTPVPVSVCGIAALRRLAKQPGHSLCQPLAGRRQPVLGMRGAARDELSLDDPGGLEVVEPV